VNGDQLQMYLSILLITLDPTLLE